MSTVTQQQQRGQKQKLDPTDNKLHISSKKNARDFIFISKIFLKKFQNVELHALGEATKISVRVAENLQRQGLVTITKINSITADIEGRKRVKLVVSLQLTQDGKARIDQELQA
ncbi:unnamed protein product (macronuclear) [Paramecium tetraurelia]|uniref:DNA/RNA-binding protein Alba-like domain-containing protein n=2 Tax=Paramecium TaxID=5884 RepID=A0CRB6_PARTE|nr:uncharacterized protein GSPATT00009648001 [Paramecium tetraurelia]CAD8150833.1 unnamed protein product [Paramecium octaurelia]CAK73333.1 unnamed protein product [Paramecium tetraurelia]|eukprot:XP_001440730.1 hypothetical protein (macronuclear) [Paramecium tetraurelia strain d4-2]